MTRDVPLLIVLALLQPSVTHGNVTAVPPSNATNETTHNKLVHTIRRQLMADNYDYMSTESEEPFPMVHELDNPETTPDEDNPDKTPEEPETMPSPPDYETSPDLSPQVNEVFIPRSQSNNDDFSGFENLSGDHGIAKNDLLYYVEDHRLKDDADTRRLGNEELQSTTQKAKFKVIKMKQPGMEGDGRRAGNLGGGPSYRRFLQEENGDGVVIINLDDAPFPEFRLPSARRQYMSHEDDADLEIAPISEMSDEMIDKLDSA